MALVAFSGWAMVGGKPVVTDGIDSSTLAQESHPLANIAVFQSGTAVLVSIFSDAGGTPLSNPFTADTDGFWIFWADSSLLVDVQMSGGVPPFAVPFTLPALGATGGGGGGGGGGAIPINLLLQATGGNLIFNGANSQAWQWQLNQQGPTDALYIGEAAGFPSTDLGTNTAILGVATTTGSTVMPLRAVAAGRGLQILPNGDIASVLGAIFIGPVRIPTITSWPVLGTDASGNVFGSSAVTSLNGDVTPTQELIAGPGITITPLGGGQTLISAVPTTGPVQLAGISLNPASVLGGTSVAGSATLTGAAPAGGAVVTLSSDNAVAQVPASVTVAANTAFATFTVTTSAVNALTTATISGDYNVTQSATLSVMPAVLISVTLNPTSVLGGSSSTGTVTLDGPAPPSGAVVAITSSNTVAAQAPPSVLIPAGATSVTFTVTTSAVAASISSTITATYNGVQAAILTVTAATLASITLNPTSVQGGGTSTATATLTGPAPTGGALVTLSTSNTTVAQVPVSVTVAAGATTATFTVTTGVVGANTSASITGNYGGARSATLTVTAAPQPIYGGVGQPGATSGTLVGNTVVLNSTDSAVLAQLQATPEVVGQPPGGWPMTPNVQSIYLLLTQPGHTFVDANTSQNLPFNTPITVTISGRTMYLYQSQFLLNIPFAPRVAT